MSAFAEISLEDAQIRGVRAQQLLDDPVLVAAFAAVESDAVEALAETKVFDADGLAQHAARLQANRALREVLRSFVTSGKAASLSRSRRA